jgi:hypothetical protein
MKKPDFQRWRIGLLLLLTFGGLYYLLSRGSSEARPKEVYYNEFLNEDKVTTGG